MIKPKISLVGLSVEALGVGDTYEEKGVNVTVFDFEISGTLEIKSDVDTKKVGEYEVEYLFIPKFIPKKLKIKRKVLVIDKDKPVIELIGKSEVNIFVGETYQDDGVKANDALDGDITDKVIVNSDLDIKKEGTYTITYEVSDTAGNKISIKRTIIVKEKPTTTTKKIITNAGSGNGVAILMYHYFYDEDAGEVGKDSNWMEIKAFEKQMQYLHEQDFYFPTWSEIEEFVLGKKNLPRKSVVVTIDDGHSSFFKLAIPVLKKYQIRATSFIITSRKAGTTYPQYKSELIDFQSHTNNMHQGGCTGGHGGLFRCIAYDKGLSDLKKSIGILNSSDAIAYPYGDVTENVLLITKDAGFKVGVTTTYGKARKGMNPYMLPRVRMYKGISMANFKNNL